MTQTDQSYPDTVKTGRGNFWKTQYQGTTLPACQYGAGHKVQEYWHETKGDVIRLYML